MPEFVEHPIIRAEAVERRLYQDHIVTTCCRGNTLVIIPTGLGKTVIAARVAAERLRRYPEGRCLILAPTRPLILQHVKTFKSILNVGEEDICVFTGETPPNKRAGTTGRLLFLTPQILENDLLAGRISLGDVVLLVFDEAHRAVGNYSYVFIAEQYLKAGSTPLILGLTASPGSSREKIDEVRRNLGIQFIEARSESSPDVKTYVAPVEIEWCTVDLPPAFREIKSHLESFIREKGRTVKEAGFLEATAAGKITFENFTDAMKRIQSEIAKYPTPPLQLRLLLSDLVALKRISYAVELLETQGLAPLKKYFMKLEALGRRSGASTSVKKILMDGGIRDAMNLTLLYDEKGVEHPKLERLLERVAENLSEGARRIIVFTNYRETARRLVERLGAIPDVRPVRFIGQSSKPDDEGLSQKEQTALLEDFRTGKYNVLVATQVAEEGIDISSADLVVFYDNVPSAVRFIQRRGRTARSSPGKVTILMAKDTRDEAYYWLAKRKEKAMREIVREMQPAKAHAEKGEEQPRLEAYIRPEPPGNVEDVEGPLIYVDNRESGSQVVKELIRLGVKVQLRELAVGDYILSDDAVVERKSASDLTQSILDKRLFNQAKELVSSYKAPFYIVEGEDPYAARGVSAQAIRGAILSLILDFRIPVLLTKTPSETALMLLVAARREQVEKKVHISVRGEKKPLTLAEQQEYLVAGLPNVERTLAKRLLSALGSVEGVFSAGEEALQKVQGVGEVIAERIRRVITAKYQPTETERRSGEG